MKKIPNKIIEQYEERWQKICYHPEGDGVHYIHSCELCHIVGVTKRIPGGHYLCVNCKKKLRLPKKETISEWIERGKKICHEENMKFWPAEYEKNERKKIWKKIIKLDYLISIMNDLSKN